MFINTFIDIFVSTKTKLGQRSLFCFSVAAPVVFVSTVCGLALTWWSCDQDSAGAAPSAARLLLVSEGSFLWLWLNVWGQRMNLGRIRHVPVGTEWWVTIEKFLTLKHSFAPKCSLTKQVELLQAHSDVGLMEQMKASCHFWFLLHIIFEQQVCRRIR